MDYRLRPGTDEDVATYRRIVYEAVSWHPDSVLPPLDETVAWPDLARYHDGWGRPGDLAVLATAGGDPVGGAFCRSFTAEDHGFGYVDPDTPEVAIAVWPAHRGRGLGARLLAALADAARASGVAQLSLSVDRRNPAVRLYRRSGYVVVSSHDTDDIMVVRL